MTSQNRCQSLHALPPGTVLHDYVIDLELGSGGFSVVYLARHHINTDWLFAIKEYLPRELAVRAAASASVRPVNAEAGEGFEDGLRRFRDEAKQLRTFRNVPSIVSCVNYFEANGTAYLVMDYDDGLPLSEFLRQREAAGQPFTEADLRAVVDPLLEGLQIVHRAGVLHRDIKPGNIFVRRPDSITGRPAQPVLIDFGAAKQNYLSRHSRSQAPYTPEYAAYEQVPSVPSEGDIGPWTDMYAVGALMWRMVAGGCPDDKRLLMPDAAHENGGVGVWSPTPRPAESRAYALHRRRSDPMISAVELGADRFSPALLQAIDYCLALYPEDRVRNCAKFLELLESETKSVSSLSNPSAETMLATSSLRAGERFRDHPASPEMVVVPKGTFRMGSPHQIWVPSAGTGLSEMARVFMMCTGSKPKSAEAVLANVRDRLFGWIRQHEQYSGRTFRDEVEDSRVLPHELQWELRDGNLDWLEEPILNAGIGQLVDEALESGYELNPRFISPFFWSCSDDWLEFDSEYFYDFAHAITRSGSFEFSPGEKSLASPYEEDWEYWEECGRQFPGGFDGLSEELGRSYWEGPMHPVTLNEPFAVGVYPVTRGEFAAFVNATGYWAEGKGGFRPFGTGRERADRTWRDPGFHQTDSHPVVCVSWNDAQEYVEWLTATTGAAYRLLSESEWEYVCRAGTSSPFHFGKTISTNVANYNGDFSYGSSDKGIFRERTTPVWSFPANAFGLHDVHGNVSEWTQDCWGTYWGASAEGSPWQCPPSGYDWQPNAVSWHKMISEERVLRGGSWAGHPADLRSANRDSCLPDHRASTIGFRVARRWR